MIIATVGVSHHNAPFEFLEKISLNDEQITKVLVDLSTRESISEVAVISTCMRTEFVLTAERFHTAFADVCDVMSLYSGLNNDEIANFIQGEFDDSAILHLFEVASGIDSALLGETEILGQVKRALERGTAEQTIGPVLSLLFRHAIEVGKRVRTETDIAKGSTSLGSAAVDLCRKSFGELAGKNAVLVGAGDAGKSVLAPLARSGLSKITVLNRDSEKAESIVPQVDGIEVVVGGLDGLRQSLTGADILISAIEVESPFVSVDDLDLTESKRTVIVDLSVPRSVDSGVGQLPNVELLNIDDLREFAEEGSAKRHASIGQVNEIIQEELSRFSTAFGARLAAPAIVRLREWAEEVRVVELRKNESKLSVLDDSDRELVDAITSAIVAKIVHTPTVELRKAAGSPTGDRLVQALYSLYQLESDNS